MNLCRPCGQDFNSLSDYDAHRVGEHDYTAQEGLLMDPPRLDGRRCLGVAEMKTADWTLDERGRWHSPAEQLDLSRVIL